MPLFYSKPYTIFRTFIWLTKKDNHIPKYRKKVLYGKVRDDIREIIKTLCKYKRVEIIAGAVCSDHVHLCVSIPPKLSVSEFVGYLKVKSALMIYDKHPEKGNKWDRSFWARGYYVDTVGRNKKQIKEYIQNQLREDQIADQMSIKEYVDPFTGSSNQKA